MSGTLYAALGSTRTTSNLYTVNPATGVMTSIGPIGFALTGLAVDPTTGILYGLTTPNSTAHPRSLITVDPVTGAGTFIGATVSGRDPLTDLAFDSLGNCYGQAQNSLLASINKATGAATLIGSGAGLPTFGGGLSFDSSDRLYGAPVGVYVGGYLHLYSINPATGLYTFAATFSGGPTSSENCAAAAASFDASDVLYASVQVAAGPGSPSWWLCTINAATGVISPGVRFSLDFVDALAWVGPTITDDFSVSLTPSTLTIPQGSSDTSTLTTVITVGGAQSVALSTSALPAGITVGFAANPITSGTSTVVTAAVAPTALSGSYTITIHCTGSLGAHHDVVLTVVVPYTNTDCSSALDLNRLGCFGDGSLLFNNNGLPDTPADEDPFNTVYDLGWHWERQAWFKLTNYSAVRTYVQFSLHNPEAGAIYFASAVYYDCPSTAISPCLLVSPDQRFIWDTLAAGATYPQFLGAVLEPGETVWLELAGDDDEGAPPGWHGDLTISWTTVAITSYDGLDDDCEVDPAAFSAPTASGSFSTEPISYCRRGTDDFVAVNNSGVLEVWKYTAGVRTVYSIANFGTADGEVKNGTDFAGGVPNTAVLLRTDGTDVWLAYFESKVVSNPYAGGTWQPWRVEVRHFTGSAFTVLNNDAAKALNTALYGLGTLEAAASPEDPGVLHVFWSEGGTSSAGNRTERVAYSKWSTSARVSQSDLLTNTAAAAGFPNADRLVTQYLFGNNADGAIRAFYVRPLGAPGTNTTVYSNVIEMWDVTAGAATILQTTTLTAFDASYTAVSKLSAMILGGSRRPAINQTGQSVIYIAVPINSAGLGGGPNLLLTVPPRGTTGFTWPDGNATESLPGSGVNANPYDIESDTENIYIGANVIRIYSRSCGAWATYHPSPDARFTTATADDLILGTGVLYAFAENAHALGQYGPLVWPILEDFYVCALGDEIVCSGGAVFDGAPAHKAAA